MTRRLASLALFLAACGGERSGTATCGIAILAGPSLIQQQLYNARAVITDAPRGLPSALPARVIGQVPAKVLVGYDRQGTIVMGYEGPGFPAAGYGLLVVDDTSQRAMGVFIYEGAEPQEHPKLGVVGAGSLLFNLYGVRLDWASVSDPRCPFFDTLPAAS